MAKNITLTPTPARTPPTGKTVTIGCGSAQVKKGSGTGEQRLAAGNNTPRTGAVEKNASSQAQAFSGKNGKKATGTGPQKALDRPRPSTQSGPGRSEPKNPFKHCCHLPPTSLLLNLVILRNPNQCWRQRDLAARSPSKSTTARTPLSFATSRSQTTSAPWP